ncbi:hypothetical protein Smp_148340 [Schistosoma mansoni]|uniref:hypothetical protein n=1 Tax=Schistosoma mansoni TaxID=6183 RepID=UPI0001A631FA|nr:hypothetical protein Smp_148340 [Schistosoma mansoni]|eukprot:XP_018650043.1 hypothetical protein Smp_148340 [Schistosoma mansoni]
MEPFFSHLISAIPPRLPIDRIQCANPFNPSMGFVLRIPTPQSPHYLLTFGAKFAILFKTADKTNSLCFNFSFTAVSDSMAFTFNCMGMVCVYCDRGISPQDKMPVQYCKYILIK